MRKKYNTECPYRMKDDREAAGMKACIFDLDGTLTDTLDSLEYSVNETMKQIHTDHERAVQRFCRKRSEGSHREGVESRGR